MSGRLHHVRRGLSSLLTVVAVCAPFATAAPAGEPTPLPSTAARLTLHDLVNSASRIEVQGRLIRFALHGHIFFDTIDDLFRYIDDEAGRWSFPSASARQAFADSLLQRGVDSRVVSMETELPLELLLTHTRAEGEAAVTGEAVVFSGRHWRLPVATYRDTFLTVRDRWARSLNCWSASPSLPGRVLSNWHVIDEGIELYGATYDSTEHFWQAVKYHPEVTVDEVRRLVAAMRDVEWRPWLDGLAADQTFYVANAYAVEFLKQNLSRDRLDGFHTELGRLAPATRARAAQQRTARAPRAALAFTPLDEKVLWGDLADVFYLVVAFADRPGRAAPAAVAAMRRLLVERRFDAIYLAGYADERVGFLSPEFQALMLEIWKVKFLRLPRFGEVIRSTAGRRLDHFLNDGDSPDIPIPVYVSYLNHIRDMAMEIRL